jgi:hypothetical protein
MELDGRWHNGAAHLVCNQWKSSRRINYNEALQARAEKALDYEQFQKRHDSIIDKLNAALEDF